VEVTDANSLPRQSVATGARSALLRRLGHFSTSNLTDEALLARAVTGSEDDFEVLVRRYSSTVYRVAYRFTGSRESAEDATQETFLKIYKALPTVKLDAPFKPWLYKIATNTAISSYRKSRGKTHVSLAAAADRDLATAPDDTALRVVEHDNLQAAISNLPDTYRQVVILRTVADLPYAEVAKILDVPEATARTWFNRAKNLLRQQLQ